MANKNFLERVLLCIFAIPVIFLTGFFLKFYNNLVMSLAIWIFAILGSFEIDRILFEENHNI